MNKSDESMNDPVESLIQSVLSRYSIPYLKQDPVSAQVVKKIWVAGNVLKVEIVLGFPIRTVKEEMIAALQALLKPHLPQWTIEISIIEKINPHAAQTNVSTISNVKNIIAIASGKGGVGKSTVTVNLAFALGHVGARVGILDADIYGPSIPKMLGNQNKSAQSEGNKLHPLQNEGVQSISIGYLIQEKTPLVWRGPMVSGALQQLSQQTLWESLDYLLVDLPPGTGDIQLTLAQKIPVSGAVIVTTPQDISLIDAQKALEMFYKVNIPVLGIIENMSMHTCAMCGHQEAIFGKGGGQKIASSYDIRLLGQLPLDQKIQVDVDQGKPTVLVNPESDISKKYLDAALSMTAQLSLNKINYAAKIPKIIIKDS